MSVCNGLMPRARSSTAAAPIRPKTAPEAPTVSASGRDQQRAEGAPQQRREVQRGEARRAERRLEHLPEDPQQVHVEAMWSRPACRKPPVTRRQYSPLATAGPSEREVVPRAGCSPSPRSRSPVARKATTQTMMIAIVTRGSVVVVAHRAHLRPLPRALRAAHADRASASCSRGRSAARRTSRRRPSRGWVAVAGLPCGRAEAPASSTGASQCGPSTAARSEACAMTGGAASALRCRRRARPSRAPGRRPSTPRRDLDVGACRRARSEQRVVGAGRRRAGRLSHTW